MLEVFANGHCPQHVAAFAFDPLPITWYECFPGSVDIERWLEQSMFAAFFVEDAL